MKKLLLLITALAGLFTMAVTVLLLVNGVHPLVAIPAEFNTAINYIITFGPLAVLSAFVLFYFSGKGLIRILLSIITIWVIALGVIATFFPTLITTVLG